MSSLRSLVLIVGVAAFGCKGTPEQRGPMQRLTYSLDASRAGGDVPAALTQTAETLRRRLDALGVHGATVAVKDGMIIADVPETIARDVVVMSTLELRGALEVKVVDDGADFSQHLFAHVGLEHSGEATDPKAVENAITAGVDQWREGDTHFDWYLVAHDRDRVPGRTILAKYLADVAAADPALAVPADHEIAFERVTPAPEEKNQRPYWRTYYVVSAARLTNADVAKASVEVDGPTKRPIVLVELSPAGSQSFATLTAQNAGKKVAIILDGTIQLAPVVASPIKSGRIALTMSGEPKAQLARSKSVATAINSGALRGPLILESMHPAP